MRENEFKIYRIVADEVEEEFWKFSSERMDNTLRINYLLQKIDRIKNVYEHVCLLRLLAGELAIHETINNNTVTYKISAKEAYVALFEKARFDPLSIICYSSYFLYDLQNPVIAKRAATYGVFIAENFSAYVRHAHQTLIRAANSIMDYESINISLRRLIEYKPSIEDPDVSIEMDIKDIINETPLDNRIVSLFMKRYFASL